MSLGTSAAGKIEVELQDWMGNDRSIAEMAWTSSTTKAGKEWKTDEQVSALVRRLVRDGHAVPLESVILRFWVRVPIMADRQIMTHRMMSSGGMSGRYRTMPSDNVEVPADIKLIASKLEYDITNYLDDVTGELHTDYVDLLTWAKKGVEAKEITPDEYKRWREFMRGILPQSAMTERTMIMNLRSWANFIRLRLSSHAQPEIREVAAQMYRLVHDAQICPVALASLASVNWLTDTDNLEWEKYV